ncbi:concanavalin A-like lectin/glucanase domain-containing protein [Cytidiella melzeri]|nr:concanavalin A-like lectin/glucanase domain-containing protein [Cytidiella melzeri]
MKTILSTLTLVSLSQLALAANFTLLKNYSGNGFFDDWDFYGNFDNLTNGDVTYVNQSQATNLAYVNPDGHAIIKVDNTSNVIYEDKRNSVRISTKEYFATGSIWVFDLVHLPFGCSVWPGIWTSAKLWPQGGEIDIVEGINQVTANQMALHTVQGCSAATGTTAINQPSITDCNSTTSSGCTVVESQPNSYGQAFASAGGGVWATQFDVSGIFIWFWSRPNVPASLTTATDSLDISTWGNPSAAYPASSCNIAEFFAPQQLIIDITLCGDWAGVPSIYASTCGGNATDPNTCYVTNVINNGSSALSTGYFEFNYIKAFGVNSSVLVNADGSSLSSSSNSSSGTGSSSGSGSSSNSSGGSGDAQGSGADVTMSPRGLAAGIAMLSLLSWLLL